MTCYEVTIPNWRPALLNEFLPRHWSVGARRKKQDQIVIGLSCRAAGVPLAKGPRRVSLHVSLGPRQHEFDEDAPWKGLLDNLKHLGYLIDDTAKYRQPGTLTFERKKPRKLATTIILEDVQP